MNKQINFAELNEKMLVGRIYGLIIRNKFNFDDLDHEKLPIIIIIPNDTYAITSSFLMGLFERSMLTFKNYTDFFEHYDFIGPDHIIGVIKATIICRFAENNLKEWKPI